MKNLLILCTLLAAAFMAACWSTETANSDTVKQSEIHQYYSVTYDAGDKEMSATAAFRFGGGTGTTLQLVEPSNVQVDGEKMALSNNFIMGTFYSTDKQVAFKNQYEFVFTDADKKTYTNKFTFYPIEITDYPTQADKSTGMTVKWADPVRNNESVSLYVMDDKGTSVYTTTTVVGATSVEITSDKLKDLYPGNANIYLTREISSSLTEATHIGGDAYLKYVSPKVGIKLTGEKPVAKN